MIEEVNVNSKEEVFLETLNDFFDATSDGLLFQKIKMKAWEYFKLLGLPTKKTESFRYVPLRKLFEKKWGFPSCPPKINPQSIKSHVLPECQESLIVLVNGRYSKELSNTQKLPSKVVVSSLEEAIHTYGSFLTNHFAKTLKEESDPFAALNAALCEEAVFIYVPPKTKTETAIQILHLIDSEDSPLILNSRLQVFAAAGSTLEFVLSCKVISGEPHFINHVSDFSIEEDSHVRLNTLLEQSSNSLWHFDATRAALKKNSTFHSFSVTNGSSSVRSDYKVSLMGENAESSINNLWILNEKNEFHAHVLMDHQAPFCRSRQLFKGALDDLAKSSFEGKILVRQAAQKTDAFQLNSNLLLNDDVQSYSKPNLEIFADDVKASHGATFGQLNEEQLFCLRSRGISALEAKNLLIFGFCKEIIDLIKIPSLQKRLIDQVKAIKSP